MLFTSEMDVQLIDFMGNDDAIIASAKVSTLGGRSNANMTTEGKQKFLEFLVKNRHGSPFEHVLFTWRIAAPIFVWREFMRHRVASYNEESARYKKLSPTFYIPASDRAFVQKGKPGHYVFEPGELKTYTEMVNGKEEVYRIAYEVYEKELEAGVAREVARMHLPVGIYSTAYVTMNYRAFTNFLSLRTKHPDAEVPSFPMEEIEKVALLMEKSIEDIVPLSHTAFREFGSKPL